MKAVIKYEDKAILVIHKPAGIATQTARIGQADVVSELKNYLEKKGEGTYLGMVHRLDQPVEGLLVFAKTPEAAKILTRQLENGTLKKSYAALVGPIREEMGVQGELEDYLLKDARTNLSKVVPAGTPNAKKARLFWRLLQNMENLQNDEIENSSCSLIEVKIFTGRHHQIRVQLSHAGMPLLGDSKYGDETSRELTKRLGIHHTALLANRLELLHPVTKEKMQFEIPYPKEWKESRI